MKILFAGSSEFACPVLQALLLDGSHTVVKVVTQPARPAGRHYKLTSTPIYELAAQNQIDTYTFFPTLSDLKKWEIDAVVVVAYGEKIAAEIHDHIPCINIHPSLLPKYRGASPIQSALWNGDLMTGVSLILLSDRMDAGDLLAQSQLPVSPDTDFVTLQDLLSALGSQLLIEILSTDFMKHRVVQNESEATYCRKIKKEDLKINWSDLPQRIHDQVRAIGGFTMHQGKRVKLIKTTFEDGNLKVLQVQPEGKKPMSYSEFVKGYGPLDGVVGR